MQFLARSLWKSIRPSFNSTVRKSWVLSQQCHSNFSTYSSRTLGGRKAEKSESLTPEWPRPTEVPYQPKIENSVDLIGYVIQPVQFDAPLDGKFWAGTVISDAPSYASESELDSTHHFRLPVVFEGDLAHTVNCHLKKDDRVHITGQIFVDFIPFGTKVDQANVQIMVSDLRYIKDSKAPQKVLPTWDHKEGVLKHSASVQRRGNFGTGSWFDLLDKPDEWWDYRESKENGSVNPKYPDFKKKDGSVALWLNKAPNEIFSNLKDVKFDTPVKSKYGNQKKGEAGEESWKDLVENMDKWWDNRLNKRNPKGPDFTHKETRVALWLADCPSWLKTKLPKETPYEITCDTTDRSQYAKQKKEESWKDLVENLDKWSDNRLNKRNPKAPDFKHKETGAALWLDNCPTWVLTRLPDPKEADDITFMRI